MDGNVLPEPDESARIPVEIQYYTAGCKFFNENWALLGYHVADLGQEVGEISPDVRRALDGLAVATAERMTAIMRCGPQYFKREA